MEAVFGVPGLVSAPVLYACLKRELRNAGLIGRAPTNAVAVVENAPAASPALGEHAPG
jgi:hypothetical protein